MSGEGLVTEYSFNNDIIRSRASSSSRTICNFLISQPAGARDQGPGTNERGLLELDTHQRIRI